MAIDLPATSAGGGLAPADAQRIVRPRLFVYLGILILLLAFGGPSGGLIDVPISFFLKNKLQLKAQEAANFRLMAAIPLYTSFIFGFMRDIWNPFGIKDRGFILLFGGVSAALYAGFAFAPMSYTTLLVGVFLVTVAFQFVASAQNGLVSTIGLQNAMTGQISAAWNVFLAIPTVVAFLIGGTLSGMLEAVEPDRAIRILFLVGAAIMAVVGLYGLWKPPSVFDNVKIERRTDVHPIQDLKRLVLHRPIYPAMLVWLLWNFNPGSSTPLQYHLQNTLHATNAQWGQWNAIYIASFIPTFILFGFLCRRLPLRTLLVWGTIIAIPQMIPIVFIHSVPGALVAAIPIGLMGGIASAAYLDLIMRSSPPGLQGTTFMMASSLYFFGIHFSDFIGARLYDHFGGFNVCVLAITIVYALILPALLLVPKSLIATADGQKGG